MTASTTNDRGREPSNWLIYGANGYTGQLIATEAVRRQLKPILAGRNADQIQTFSQQLDCESRVFDLRDRSTVAGQLADVSLVLNCAGPFSRTSKAMIDACISTGSHYLDITGEIEAIELAAARHDQARDAGIALLPAVGFDVVPSDCLARTVAESLERPVSLQLAFAANGSISPGTARTILETAGHGGRVRKDGKIIRVPNAWKTAEIPFRDKTRSAVTIPWGDVASAYYSTGVPDIEVYCAQSRRNIRMMQMTRWAEPVFRLRAIKRLGNWWIDRRVSGPTEQERQTGRTQFWARAADAEGHTSEATLETPDGYATTVETSLEIVSRFLAGESATGFLTPAKAFGATFIDRFPTMQLHRTGESLRDFSKGS